MTGTTDREARTGSVLRLALPRGRGWTKAVTAGVSVLTAVSLWPLIPPALPPCNGWIR